MNPDPNQPQSQPAPETPVVPPIPYAAAPVVQPDPTPAPASAPNPFAAAYAPVEPAQPTSIIGSSPNNDPVPDYAPVNSRKKFIIRIGVLVGGLLVLGGAALAIYLIFFSVTKADYQKAFDVVSLVQTKASATSDASSSTTTTSLDDAKTNYADFKTDNAKLADLKAYKNDKDLKAKYDAFETKEKAYESFYDVLIPSMSSFVSTHTQIEGLPSGTDILTTPTDIQKAIDILKGATGITDPTLKAFVDAELAAYQTILPQAQIYVAAGSTTSQKLAALNAISDAATKVSDASLTMSQTLEKNAQAVSISDSLDALGKATTDKLNAAK